MLASYWIILHVYGRRLLTICFLVGAAVFASACTSEDIDDMTAVPDRIGIVELVSFTSAAYKVVSAQFLELTDSVDSTTIDTIINYYQLPTPGSCSVDSEEPLQKLETSALDVGGSIIFSSDAGTYATVERESKNDDIIYESELYRDGPFPTTLTLNITSGDFHTGEGLSVPLANGTTIMVEPTLDGPPDRVYADTVYRWTPSTPPGGQSFIQLRINFTDVITNSVLCVLPESGEFSLPEETLAILRARNEIAFDNSIGSLYAVGTFMSRVQRTDESVIVIRHLHESHENL